MFSIIIPTYNRALLLPQTLNSVLNQTYKNFEVVLIDDGSTDETESLVKRQYNNPQIKYIKQENQGRSVARNVGVANASYEFICFLDSDDLYHEKHLELLYTFVSKYSEYDVYILDGIRMGNRISPTFFPETMRHNAKTLWFDNTIVTGGICARKKVFEEFTFPNYNYYEISYFLVLSGTKFKTLKLFTYSNYYREHSARSINDFENYRSIIDENLNCLTELYSRKHVKEKISLSDFRKRFAERCLTLCGYAVNSRDVKTTFALVSKSLSHYQGFYFKIFKIMARLTLKLVIR